jgi:hypothetical protein
MLMIDFLDRCRFLGLVVEVVGAVKWTYVVEVEVVVGRGWVAYMLDQTDALASVPIGKGYQLPADA